MATSIVNLTSCRNVPDHMLPPFRASPQPFQFNINNNAPPTPIQEPPMPLRQPSRKLKWLWGAIVPFLALLLIPRFPNTIKASFIDYWDDRGWTQERTLPSMFVEDGMLANERRLINTKITTIETKRESIYDTLRAQEQFLQSPLFEDDQWKKYAGEDIKMIGFDKLVAQMANATTSFSTIY
jgi:hypothetical protein